MRNLWIARQLKHMVDDEPPRWVRKMRRWTFATKYCAFIQTIGALTLFIRPFHSNVTGRTYPQVDTFGECYPLALLMLLGILLAALTPDSPDFCSMLFVIMTACIRSADVLHPLSIVPLWAYIFLLIPRQFCALMEWKPLVWVSRKVGVYDAHPPG